MHSSIFPVDLIGSMTIALTLYFENLGMRISIIYMLCQEKYNVCSVYIINNYNYNMNTNTSRIQTRVDIIKNTIKTSQTQTSVEVL